MNLVLITKISCDKILKLPSVIIFCLWPNCFSITFLCSYFNALIGVLVIHQEFNSVKPRWKLFVNYTRLDTIQISLSLVEQKQLEDHPQAYNAIYNNTIPRMHHNIFSNCVFFIKHESVLLFVYVLWMAYNLTFIHEVTLNDLKRTPFINMDKRFVLYISAKRSVYNFFSFKTLLVNKWVN